MLDEELVLRELELLLGREGVEVERLGVEVERLGVEVERLPDELDELLEEPEELVDRPAPGTEELLDEVEVLLLDGLLERGLKVKPEVSSRSRVSVPS